MMQDEANSLEKVNLPDAVWQIDLLPLLRGA